MGSSIHELPLDCHLLAVVHQFELLGLADLAVGLAIHEGSLLALDLCATSLLVLAEQHLAVLSEAALIEVAVGEVEAAFDEHVMEHESVEKGTISVVLLRLARALALEL